MPASGAFDYSYRAVGDIKSTHQYDVTVTFKITFGTGSYGYNYSGAYYEIWCDGQMQSGTATFDIGYGQWGTIGSKTFRITMGSSGQSKNINFGGYISTGVSPSEISTGTVFGCTLPAVTWLWTVSYNANGGSGAPSSQTKTYGSTLKLSSTKPTKTGHTFQGWATSKSGSVAYAAGANYTNNSAVTLYAVWKANTWTVRYNANGGSGAPGNQTKTYGQKLTLSSVKPTRNLYNFKGWGTSADSTTVAYAPGATYTSNAAITLYAIWELAWVAPRITNVVLERCTSDGTASEFGTYYKIDFAWAADAASPRIVVKHKEDGASTWISDYRGDGKGTSGTHTGVYGAGGLSTEKSYDVRVAVDDEIETSAYDTQIAPIAYAIDFKAGGKGVAFGKPATNNVLACNMVRQYDKSGYFVNVSGQGKGGYAKICRINGTTYFNVGIRLTIAQRGKYMAVVNIIFKSQNSLNLTLDNASVESLNSVIPNVYLAISESHCDVYVKFTEAFDSVALVNAETNDPYMSEPNRYWLDTSVAERVDSLPNVYITAGFASIVKASGGSWVYGRDNAVVRQTKHTTSSGDSFNPVVSVKTNNGDWCIGNSGDDNLNFVYTTDANYNAGKNIFTNIALNNYTSALNRRLYAGVLLYDNSSGSNGTITLSNSADNYWMLEIYFRTHDGTAWVDSCKVWDANGKIAHLYSILAVDETSNGTIWVKARAVSIQGTTITSRSGRTAEAWFNGENACGYGAGTNRIYITKVVGYV